MPPLGKQQEWSNFFDVRGAAGWSDALNALHPADTPATGAAHARHDRSFACLGWKC